METLQAIASRQSTRAFGSAQVPEEALRIILAAGCAAPVGMARYDTLHLAVIRNKDLLAAISDYTVNDPECGRDIIYDAPTLVVISALAVPQVPYIEYANASCVAENMLLAAADQGIDSIYLWNVVRVFLQNEKIKKALDLPAGFTPLLAVGLGYAITPKKGQKELKITIATKRID